MYCTLLLIFLSLSYHKPNHNLFGEPRSPIYILLSLSWFSYSESFLWLFLICLIIITFTYIFYQAYFIFVYLHYLLTQLNKTNTVNRDLWSPTPHGTCTPPLNALFPTKPCGKMLSHKDEAVEKSCGLFNEICSSVYFLFLWCVVGFFKIVGRNRSVSFLRRITIRKNKLFTKVKKRGEWTEITLSYNYGE
jgi:magnesium-transporting ATPase (P-type)